MIPDKDKTNNDPIIEFKRLHQYYLEAARNPSVRISIEFYELAVIIANQIGLLIHMIDYLHQDNAYLKKQYNDLIESLEDRDRK